LLSSSAFSPLCIGATIYAFNVICPGASVQHLSLIHPHYRKLCRVLVDVDEWGQVELMKLLLRYARVMLPKPSRSDEGGEKESSEEIDPDLKLLLNSVEPTFQSRNPAVVIAATKIFYYLAPPSMFGKFMGPIMRLLLASNGTASGVERVVLRYVVQLTSGEESVAVRLFLIHEPYHPD
jgi:AP-3 complex subunit beta